MVSRLERRIAMRRKLHILRTLTRSKSVKKSSTIIDALLYIHKLKLKVESIRRELSNPTTVTREKLGLMNQVHQLPMKKVKVEKGEKGFVVRVNICEKRDNMLASILEVFEEMGLIVLHAKVSCNLYFAMEAIVVAQQQHPPLQVNNITQALLKAVEAQQCDCGEGQTYKSSVI